MGEIIRRIDNYRTAAQHERDEMSAVEVARAEAVRSIIGDRALNGSAGEVDPRDAISDGTQFYGTEDPGNAIREQLAHARELDAHITAIVEINQTLHESSV